MGVISAGQTFKYLCNMEYVLIAKIFAILFCFYYPSLIQAIFE